MRLRAWSRQPSQVGINIRGNFLLAFCLSASSVKLSDELMKEVVFTEPPYMNASEQRIADMHSVLNLLNVLVGELSLIEPNEPVLAENAASLEGELDAIIRVVKEGGPIAEIIRRIRAHQHLVEDFMNKAMEKAPLLAGKQTIEESLKNMDSVFRIFKNRLDEIEMRADDPNLWVSVEPTALRSEIEGVFVAIAKNARGKYQIHFNLAQKEAGDYYIDLKIDVRRGDNQLWMPLRLIDVLRDLTANARKYTVPGGKVVLAVYQDESNLRAVIEDTGCGIPEDEIEKVAEFGYRASNARGRPTFGGGFGLTKAIWLVTNWGGCLSLKSELDRGTEIRITIPNAAPPACSKACSI